MKIWLILAIICFSPQAFADPTEPAPRFEIRHSSVHKIRSGRLQRNYDVYIKTPAGYDDPENTGKRWPVMYLNDGPYTFTVAAGATHLRKMDKAILVGISYAEGENGMASRVRDLTPRADESWQKYRTGGAEDYLGFLEHDVMPFVESRFRTDAARRVLVGQSLGGSFGAWVLLRRPTLFSSYILTSPSLWYKDRMIFELERQFASQHTDLKARVFLAVGELENRSNGMQNDMVQDLLAFSAQLRARNYPGLEIRMEILPGATHESAFPLGFTRGLLWLLSPPQP